MKKILNILEEIKRHLMGVVKAIDKLIKELNNNHKEGTPPKE